MILGIDTSCYTTSLAVADHNGVLLEDLRLLINVPMGKRGLAQSEIFYQHINQAPLLFTELFSHFNAAELTGIAVSVKPRPLAESYMPVFKAGENFAKTLAAVLRLPLYETSHQEGHLSAALWSLGRAAEKIGGEFLALHLSGGTGEILRVKRERAAFAVDICGSCDLAPGQYIDRVGVALGLPFPTGPCMQDLAKEAQGGMYELPQAAKDGQLYFTGPQSACDRLLSAGGINEAELALAVLENIGKSLKRAIAYHVEKTGLKQVVIVGGVAANEQIRGIIGTKIGCSEVLFANRKYAGDNAVGVAMLFTDESCKSANYICVKK